MKIVSNEYKDSMNSILRGQSLVKVLFSNVNTTASSDGEWDDNDEHVSYSEFDTVNYEYDYGATYSTLELNRWLLNGTQRMLGEVLGIQEGFVSNILSDEEGEYTNKPIIIREFENHHAIPGLTINFDTVEKDYPLQLSVYYYYQGQLVDTQVVSVKDTMVTVACGADEVDKIEIEIDRMLPYRRIRIERIQFGLEVVFGNDEIVSTSQSHDVDPLTRRLPEESMSFTIIDFEHKYDPDNTQGLYKYIDKNSPIEIRFGYRLPNDTIEWVKGDKYVLSGKPSVANDQATFKGTGLIGSMSKTYYKGVLGTHSLYELAESVLEDAGLNPTPQGENPWVIDESLQNIYTNAPLPIDTHMNCLQLIAHAGRCRLYTDDDNVIHIKSFGVTLKGIYSGVTTDNGHEEFSEWASVDKGNSYGNSYITLELNRWLLNEGEQIILPDENPSGRGYISSYMTDEEGDYDTAPTFTKVFNVLHDLPIVNINFDTTLKYYPQSVEIKYYDEDDNLLDTQTADVEDYRVTLNSSLALQVKKIEVSVQGGLPYSRLRINKIYYRETDFVLDFSSISEHSQSISKIETLKAVEVTKYQYVATDSASTLFEGSTTDNTIHIELGSKAQDINITVTGGTIVSQHIYAQAVDLEMSNGTKNIVITGKTLNENTIVKTYPIDVEGEVDTEENPLVTSDSLADDLALWVSTYLQMRNTYDAEYRGNPEVEVGDIIGLQTRYTNEMDALVLVDNIDFNGSLSGKLKVKGLI